MIKNLKHQTKKGGASIYVTIFVALIISVVTLSFARLAISELSKSGDADLNQSAYDSALAGVEDAKLAISACLKDGKTLNECNMVSANPDDCNSFLKQTKYIQRNQQSDGAVFIEESGNQTGTSTSQAYTCVVLNNDLPDYLGQLNSDYRIRVIPLKTRVDLKTLDSVILSWYENPDAKCPSGNCSGSFGTKENAPVPPVLAVSVVQAGENFTRDALNNTNNGRFGSVVLYPNGNIGNDVAMAEVSTGELVSAADKGGTNQAKKISCHSTDAYACSVRIKLPNVSRYNNTTYLVVAMPYDNTSASFKVAINDASNSIINFHDAQIAVDSTGRANDIYRRVEARVDTIDTYYPYPIFGFESASTYGSEGNISKDFWTTRNCWAAVDGAVADCPNSGSSAQILADS